jgi:PAS domain-containing protein
MPQRPVELILARQLASGLAVPVLLVDARGDTLFFNEPAEPIFGRRFDEMDELSLERRTAVLRPRDEQGEPVPIDDLPGMVAMRDRQPAHVGFYIHSYDGVRRAVEATAIPLESAGGRVLGAFIVLWATPDRDGPAEAP